MHQFRICFVRRAEEDQGIQDALSFPGKRTAFQRICNKIDFI